MKTEMMDHERSDAVRNTEILLQGVEEVKCTCMFATIAKCSYSSWLLFSCDTGSLD